MIYEFYEGYYVLVCQFEMFCVDGKQWDSAAYSLSAPGEDYATIGLRTIANCSACVTFFQIVLMKTKCEV